MLCPHLRREGAEIEVKSNHEKMLQKHSEELESIEMKVEFLVLIAIIRMEWYGMEWRNGRG